MVAVRAGDPIVALGAAGPSRWARWGRTTVVEGVPMPGAVDRDGTLELRVDVVVPAPGVQRMCLEEQRSAPVTVAAPQQDGALRRERET